MKLSGLQKTTLLDFPGHVACTVFTAGCNLRCPFCHNASLVRGDEGETVDTEEFFRFLEKRKGILDGVCVTGGEPTLHPGLPAFLSRIKALGLAVKLDTNGTRPDRLRAMARDGLLDYVAMDIKNAPGAYAKTVGIPGYDEIPVWQSADFLLAGEVPYEFRTTVVAELHTKEQIGRLAERIAGARAYFLQMFKDSGDLLAGGLHEVSEEVLQGMLEAARPAVPSVCVRGR